MANAVTVLAVDLVAAGADFEKRLAAASGAVTHTANRFDQFNKAAQKAETRGNELGASMERLTANLSLGVGVTSMAVGGFVALEAALLRVGLAATTAFAEFDAVMTRVQSITGENAAGMAMLTDEVKRLNETSPLSGVELARGLEMLAMGGLNATQAMIALEGTQKLAVVGNLDMGRAADTATNAINQFGVGAEGLKGILDSMAVAVTRSNTNLSQLGTALNYAAGAATGAGLSINETMGALAAFANVGYKASMGGTALRGSISRLLDPTAEAAKVMKSMSLEVQDATGKMLPMSAILEQLVRKQATTGEVFSIFGQRAGGAMLALMANGYKSVDMLRELEQATGDAAGSLDKMFGTQAQSLENKIKAAESAFENLKITIGAQLEPAVAVVVDAFQALFTDMANSGKLVEYVGTGVAALVVGFQGLTYAVHAAATVLAVLNAGVVLVEAGLRVVVGTVGAVVSALLIVPAILYDLATSGLSSVDALRATLDNLGESVSMVTGVFGFLSDESDKADQAMDSLTGGLESARGKADEAMDAFTRLNKQMRDQEAARSLGQSMVTLGNLLVTVAGKVEKAWNDALMNPLNGGLRALDKFGSNWMAGAKTAFAPWALKGAPPDTRGFDNSRLPIPPDQRGGGGVVKVGDAISRAMIKVEKASDKASNALEKIAKDEERRREKVDNALAAAMGKVERASDKAAAAALKHAQAMEELLNWRKYYQKPNEIYRTANFVSGMGQGFEGVASGVQRTAADLTKADELKYLHQQLKIEDSLIEREKIRNQLLQERLKLQNDHIARVGEGAAATLAAIGAEINLVGVLVDKNSTQKEVTSATIGLMSNLGAAAGLAMETLGMNAEKSMRVQAALNALLAITALGLGLMNAFTNPVAAGSYFAAAATLGGKSIGGFIGASAVGDTQSEFVAPVKDRGQREEEKRDMREAFRQALEDVGLDELARRDIANNYYLYDPVATDRREIQARKLERQAERAKRRTL